MLLIIAYSWENEYYRNNPKYWNRQAWANSVDPDQMPHSAASDLGLHCLPLIQETFKHINRSKMDIFTVSIIVVSFVSQYVG